MTKTARRPQGEDSLFQRKSDGRWIARIFLGYDDDGRRRYWTGTAKTQALALAKLQKARKELLVTGTVATSTVTVKSWLTEWINNVVFHTVGPNTWGHYESSTRVHLIPRLGRHKLTDLTPAHVEAMTKAIAAKGHHSAAAKARATLEKALNDAMRLEKGGLTRNVAHISAAPPIPAIEMKALSLADVEKFLAANKDEWLCSLWLGLFLLGNRQGELTGLEWDRADLDAEAFDISWKLGVLPYRHGCLDSDDKQTCHAKRKDGCPQRELNVNATFEYRLLTRNHALSRPKTDASTRMEPIPGLLANALRDHRRAGFGMPNPHGLVWPRPDGAPYHRRSLYTEWQAALERAGLPPMKMHATRNTTATLLQRHATDKTIQELLGHTKITQTRAYQVVNLDEKRAATNALAASLG
jgi:integrase